jgi:uncharacterized protein (TIGR03067 family)
MVRALCRPIFLGAWFAILTPLCLAHDSLDQAIEKERKVLEGTWRMTYLEIDGNRVAEDDFKKLTVVNAADGTWSLRVDDNEINKGNSTLDPTMKPKTVDFTPSDGDNAGKLHQGIYELDGDTRRLCVAPPGQPRPKEFSSNSGSQHILITFAREKK